MSAREWSVLAPDPPADAAVAATTEAPTFSVVIPAYQAAAYVLEAVMSVLRQTKPALEVIVVDDGSTDDLAGALASTRGQITILREAHGGVSAARNHGLTQAAGVFVTILDADDVFLTRRLEALSHLAQLRPDLDILTTDAYVMSGEDVRRFYSATHPFPVQDQELEILKRCFLLGNSAIRREVLLDIGGFDESLRRAEDWDCWIRLLRHGARAGLIETPLAEYRQTPDSLTSNRVESLRARVLMLEKTLADTDPASPAYTIILSSLRTVRERIRREVAKAAILSGRGARRPSTAVAFGSGTSLRNRLRALVAVAAPGLARRRLRN